MKHLNPALSPTGAMTTLRRRGKLFVVLAALAIPLALASIAWLLTNQARHADALRESVEQSFERRLMLEQILSLHQDIETSTRGYALTGRDEFLQPYRAAEPKIDPVLASLDRMDGESIGNSRLATLRNFSVRKRAFARETVVLCHNGDTATALARIRSGEGKRLMDAIRGEIARLQSAEANQLSMLSARSASAQNRLEATAMVILLLLMSLLVTAGLLIGRTIRSRARALDAVADLSRRRKAVLDGAMDGIFILNPSGTIESVNRTGARMFGYDEEELARRDIGMLFANPPPIGQVAAYLRQMNLREGEPGELQEIPSRCKDGSPLAADVAISAVSLTDGTHYVAVVRDMSERKKIDRMKAEFVASVSHELRTPLTSIAGALGLLSGGAGGALPEKAARLISIASSNADRLVRLINDILDIEKIDAGRMTFDNRILLLSEITAQAVEANRHYAERLGVTIAFDPGESNAVVWADPDRLMQVLANLISNAAKFSPAGETIDVRIEAGKTEHRISVRDKGPGISAEFAKRIFNRFAQADSSDARQKEGTGLGLAIVREITQRLGGRISYESPPGQGASFHVDLPAARMDKLPATDDRILLCEHDPEIASALAGALTTRGLRCDIVASTTDAQLAVAQTGYRVILVDSNLPSGGGIALVRLLRETLGLNSTPILMISAEADRGNVGVDALHIAEWLCKPVALDSVVAAVSRALDHTPHGEMPRIVHIEDDPDIVRLVEAALEGRATVMSASSIVEARKLITTAGPDLAILDLGLSDGSGLELLADLASAYERPIPVIVFSAQDADPEVAARVQAYLTKSHTPIDRLVHTVIRLAGATQQEASQ